MEIKVSIQVNSFAASLSAPLVPYTGSRRSVFPPQSHIRIRRRSGELISVGIKTRDNDPGYFINIFRNIFVTTISRSKLVNEI